jgi:hypothetical protein
MGICRVTGGELYVVDTEGRRALHYADKFKFRHVSMGAPFSPADYKLAIQHCLKKAEPSGKKPTILVDSMSHEHEGPGGVLEWHEKELDRMAGQDQGKRNRQTFAAWAKPKAARRDLINFILQQNANFLFAFRAKKKLKIRPGREPEERGFEAISGEEWIYEMTLKCLLLPGANGVPTWNSDLPGERELIKIPEQFRALFSSSPQLTEDIGQALASWAAGVAAPKPLTAEELLESYGACSDAATLGRLESLRSVAWPKLSKDDKANVKKASEDAKERIERASRAFEETETEPESDSDGDYQEAG